MKILRCANEYCKKTNKQNGLFSLYSAIMKMFRATVVLKEHVRSYLPRQRSRRRGRCRGRTCLCPSCCTGDCPLWTRRAEWWGPGSASLLWLWSRTGRRGPRGPALLLLQLVVAHIVAARPSRAPSAVITPAVETGVLRRAQASCLRTGQSTAAGCTLEMSRANLQCTNSCIFFFFCSLAWMFVHRKPSWPSCISYIFESNFYSVRPNCWQHLW